MTKYFKVNISTSEIFEAKDEADAIELMVDLIHDFNRDSFDWEVEDVTESPFFTPDEPDKPGIGFPLI